MSDAPYGGPPPASGGGTPHPTDLSQTLAGYPYGPPPVPAAERGGSRVPLILVSLVALVSLCVAIASWFRPSSDQASPAELPKYSEQQVTDAKAAVCDAYQVIFAALTTAASRTSSDPTDAFVLSVELKLALHASGDYLQSELRKHPATPEVLASAIDELSYPYHRVILDQLADAPDSDIDALRANIRSAERSVREECGT